MSLQSIVAVGSLHKTVSHVVLQTTCPCTEETPFDFYYKYRGTRFLRLSSPQAREALVLERVLQWSEPGIRWGHSVLLHGKQRRGSSAPNIKGSFLHGFLHTSDDDANENVPALYHSHLK